MRKRNSPVDAMMKINVEPAEEVRPHTTPLDAKEDILDALWETFYWLKIELDAEVNKANIDLERLQILIRCSSQAADNYRYHAGH